MATSRHAKEDIINALSAGADNFIAKPFSDKTLAQQLTPILDSLRPNEKVNEFIEDFTQTEHAQFKINHGVLQLIAEDKVISINIPQLIYHGALKVENLSSKLEAEIHKE